MPRVKLTGKRTIAGTLLNGESNKRPRVEDEIRVADNVTELERIISCISPYSPEPSPTDAGDGSDNGNWPPTKPPSNTPSRDQVQDDGTGNKMTNDKPDDAESRRSESKAGNGERSGSEKEDLDIDQLIPAGPYAEFMGSLRVKTKDCFPLTMMIRLEANRRRSMVKTTEKHPHSMAYAIMYHKVELPESGRRNGPHQTDYGFIHIKPTKEAANLEAMTSFYDKNPTHLCSSEIVESADHLLVGSNTQNSYESPFVEIKNYSDRTRLEAFFKESGGGNFSAWGINSAGCVGLLAAYEWGFHMVYVEEMDFI